MPGRRTPRATSGCSTTCPQSLGPASRPCRFSADAGGYGAAIPGGAAIQGAEGRRLVDGVPGLEQLALDAFTKLYERRPDQTSQVEEVLRYLDQLIDLEQRKRILIVGCGPRPEPLRLLRERGFEAVGVEPVDDFVEAARRNLDDRAAVLEGSAESLPAPDCSQDVVILESVLEHVESVGASLAEAYRVLAPGGVAYITTTNRLHLVRNGEFNVPLFQWLPALVKEAYVFHHLHRDPRLANATERPAVHWFTYSQLCRLGREAGFFKFYSLLDVKAPVATDFSGSERVRRLKAKTLEAVQTRPWLKALALTQRGSLIFMVKRG
jgi:SAM-dependent methyltransferase